MRRAVTVLQRSIRRYLRLKRYGIICLVVHLFSPGHSNAEQNAAARRPQLWYRGATAHHKYQRARRAAIKLQALYFRRIALLAYRRSREAIIRLQQWVRARRVRARYLRVRESVITMQRAVRGFIARRRLEQQRIAARSVQRSLQGFTTRLQGARRLRSLVVAQAMARMFVQRLWRRRAAKAATKVQSVWRMYATKQRIENMRRGVLVLSALPVVSLRGMPWRDSTALLLWLPQRSPSVSLCMRPLCIAPIVSRPPSLCSALRAAGWRGVVAHTWRVLPCESARWPQPSPPLPACSGAVCSAKTSMQRSLPSRPPSVALPVAHAAPQTPRAPAS